MVARHSSKANSALGEGCTVASLAARELQDTDYISHLSVGERAKYLALPGQIRKREWLGARLAAKYIFLDRLETSPATQDERTQDERWRPALSKLSADALDHYPSWMYQQVEVVTAGEKPSLLWCGQARPESVSLSHSCGMSCASLTFGAPTAIDIETTLPRLDAFYRINFSDAERRWAVSAASSSSDWFFTLLWTLKESVLKLGCFAQANVWNLPGIEIAGLPDANDIGPFWSSSTLSSEFAAFTLSVKERSRVIAVQVAVTGTRNFVLTVINPLGGVVK
jgi:4'-phosphopantetheinyl transferase EntD